MGMLFSVMASWRVRTAEQDRLIARVHELTATVESTVSVACFLNDATLAKEIATGLMKNRIVSGRAHHRPARGVAQLRRPCAETRARTDGADSISKPIYSPFDASAVVGAITLFVSHAEIEAQAIAYSRYTTWMLGLQVAIVAAGVAFLVYLLVTRPIKGISDELHRLEIRSGMRLTVPSYRRTDEIGQLVMDVNYVDHAALGRAVHRARSAQGAGTQRAAHAPGLREGRHRHPGARRERRRAILQSFVRAHPRSRGRHAGVVAGRAAGAAWSAGGGAHRRELRIRASRATRISRSRYAAAARSGWNCR